MSTAPKILVVDDEESMRNFMEIMLKKEGYRVSTASGGKEALHSINKSSPDLVIADVMMPEMSGMELLTSAKRKREDLHFIMMTAFASVDSAVEALKKGAADYITKPFKVDEIKHVIRKLLDNVEIRAENAKLKEELQGRFTLDNFVGNAKVVQELKDLVKQVALSDSTALILGESGTGKDLIARAIHSHSRRRDGAFVAINCGAIPEQLLESELFGHVKGSFTGAISNKEGQFQVADKGILFLDEIGNLPPGLQVKLLRVLESSDITPVGATSARKVDVRVIAATNSNLEEEVKAHRFRADLYYRLNVIPIYLPTLSERREDIPLLVEHFLARIASKHNSPAKKLSRESFDLICSFDWPGNVRELQNTITRAFILSKGEIIKPSDFPDQVRKSLPGSGNVKADVSKPTLESIERAYIYWVLSQTNWNKSKAARQLGIDASTLYRKIDRYKLKK